MVCDRCRILVRLYRKDFHQKAEKGGDVCALCCIKWRDVWDMPDAHPGWVLVAMFASTVQGDP
jgi:hypothetical protein